MKARVLFSLSLLISLLIAVGIGQAALQVYHMPAMQDMERELDDLRRGLYHQWVQDNRPPVVIVAIDELTFELSRNSWDWNTPALPRLVQAVAEHASAVAVMPLPWTLQNETVFRATPSLTPSVAPPASPSASPSAPPSPPPPGLPGASVIGVATPAPRPLQPTLADVLKAHSNVILVALLDDNQTLNMPPVEGATVGLRGGFADADGVIRKFRLEFQGRDRIYSSVALLLFQRHVKQPQGWPGHLPRVQSGGYYLGWTGPAWSIPRVSAARILAGQDLDRIKGRIAIIAPTAGVLSRVVTPVEKVAPNRPQATAGELMVAEAASTLQPLSLHRLASEHVWWMLTLMPALAFLLFRYSGIGLSILWLIFIVVLFVTACVAALLWRLELWPVIVPLGALAAAWLAAFAVNLLSAIVTWVTPK